MARIFTLILLFFLPFVSFSAKYTSSGGGGPYSSPRQACSVTSGCKQRKACNPVFVKYLGGLPGGYCTTKSGSPYGTWQQTSDCEEDEEQTELGCKKKQNKCAILADQPDMENVNLTLGPLKTGKMPGVTCAAGCEVLIMSSSVIGTDSCVKNKGSYYCNGVRNLRYSGSECSMPDDDKPDDDKPDDDKPDDDKPDDDKPDDDKPDDDKPDDDKPDDDKPDDDKPDDDKPDDDKNKCINIIQDNKVKTICNGEELPEDCVFDKRTGKKICTTDMEDQVCVTDVKTGKKTCTGGEIPNQNCIFSGTKMLCPDLDDKGNGDDEQGGDGEDDDDDKDKKSKIGGGSCETRTPPTCSGDAVQCYIAKEEFKQSCTSDKVSELFDDFAKNGSPVQEDSEQFDNGIKALKGEKKDLSSSLKTEGLGWSRSCPRSFSIDLGSSMGTIHVSADVYCDWLKIAGKILFGLNLIACAFYILRG